MSTLLPFHLYKNLTVIDRDDITLQNCTCVITPKRYTAIGLNLTTAIHHWDIQTMLWDFVHNSHCGIMSCGILACGILSVRFWTVGFCPGFVVAHYYRLSPALSS